MNAGIAGELIAKFIGKRWPTDKKPVFEIIRLGVNKAWQEGRWLGMASEFFVPIQKDSDGQTYIIAPKSNPILLAMNGNRPGVTIRDKYFMFHRNGTGDVRNSPSCSWNKDVYDLGYTPVLDKNNIISKGIKIGVRSVGPAGENEKIWINGFYEDSNQVYTYAKTNYGQCSSCRVDAKSVNTIKGIALDITSKFNYVCNITFADIGSISKTVTQSPIEVIAIDSFNNGYLIARLEPNERFSKYRKYLVPAPLCGHPCIHGIFKIAQQEEITSDTDDLVIKNEEALIALAKGIDYMYYKDQPEAGAGYILQAISVLDKEKNEEESPDVFPIQVSGIYEGDMPEVMKYFS